MGRNCETICSVEREGFVDPHAVAVLMTPSRHSARDTMFPLRRIPGGVIGCSATRRHHPVGGIRDTVLRFHKRHSLKTKKRTRQTSRSPARPSGILLYGIIQRGELTVNRHRPEISLIFWEVLSYLDKIVLFVLWCILEVQALLKQQHFNLLHYPPYCWNLHTDFRSLLPSMFTLTHRECSLRRTENAIEL